MKRFLLLLIIFIVGATLLWVWISAENSLDIKNNGTIVEMKCSRPFVYGTQVRAELSMKLDYDKKIPDYLFQQFSNQNFSMPRYENFLKDIAESSKSENPKKRELYFSFHLQNDIPVYVTLAKKDKAWWSASEYFFDKPDSGVYIKANGALSGNGNEPKIAISLYKTVSTYYSESKAKKIQKLLEQLLPWRNNGNSQMKQASVSFKVKDGEIYAFEFKIDGKSLESFLKDEPKEMP